ncbi:class I SAM-dependent methyltransferase [Luminiphilus sp.]|nr:class I SAM-dependent methyltransferase [Luminiphilus sp.]
MHATAMSNAEQFFNTYVHNNDSKKNMKIVEIGSQDINGGIRQLAPKDSEFVGLDFQAGPGVDLLLSDPYVLPLEDENCDVVVSSSCFEHSEFFWLTFLEALRILKPHGLLYINAPSNGSFHRYPVDC